MAPQSATKRPESSGTKFEVGQPFGELPELVLLGNDTLHSARGLPPHAHHGTLEICLVASGAVRWRTERDTFDLHGGQVFCAWPEEIHGGVDDVLEPCSLAWLLLELPRTAPASFLGLPPGEGRKLHHTLWKLPRRTFAASPVIAQRFDELRQFIAQEGPLVGIMARATLLRLLTEVCQDAQHPGQRHAYSAPVAAAIELMHNEIETPLSVPDIAARVGQSASHLHRMFRAETGLSPGDYYTRHRISLARRMLVETRQPIVEIALRCGFGSSQYFATCFRRVTGRSPSSYRRNG